MASEINTKDQLAAMLSAKLNEFLDGVSDSSVSYTHLTLPTICSV